MITITENDNRFYVRESTLPDAGLGLFARVKIPKGSFIEIIGVMVKRGSVADQCTRFAENYKFAASDKDYCLIPMGYGGMVNHANTKEQQNVVIKNVKAKVPNKKIKELRGILSFTGEAVYYFTRDVEPDEEILGDYGHEYKAHHKWIADQNEMFNNLENDWIKFLSFGLYNLPLLSQKMTVEK